MHRADENPQGIKSPLPSSPQSMPDGNWGLHTTCLVHGLPGFSHGTELQLPKSDLWLPSLSCLPFSVFPGIASPTNYLHLIPGFRTAYGRIWTKTVIFKNFFFNWRKVALQCCDGLCSATMQISHNYTHVTSPLSLPLSFHPSPLDHHRAPGQAPRVRRQLLTSYLFDTWQCVYVRATRSTCLSPSCTMCTSL